MGIKRFLKKTAGFVLNSMATQTQVYYKLVSLAPSELLIGRTALVTGGTSGIGYEIAKAFIKAGSTVVITGRSQDRIDNAVEQLKRDTNSKDVYGLQLDNKKVSEFEDKLNSALNIVSRPIDILVNNAGVLTFKTVADEYEEEYDEVLDTNLKGVFFLSQIFSRYMIGNGIKGNILNIASSSSLRPAVSAYTLSKWGIRGLTLGLAKMLTPYGITVNGLAPGQTLTPMVMNSDKKTDICNDSVPLKRYILPGEIANMAVILVSDMGRSIIGDIIYMTGGAGIVTYEDMNYDFYK